VLKRPKKSIQKTKEEYPKDLRRVPNRPKKSAQKTKEECPKDQRRVPNRPKKSVQKTKDDCPKDQRIVPKRPKKSAEKTKARRVPKKDQIRVPKRLKCIYVRALAIVTHVYYVAKGKQVKLNL
jgi:hypothetical protein